jgi:acetoin utilization deacetylase AcuC-like enzyme
VVIRAYYHDTYTFPLPDGHRFPIEKYALLRLRLLELGILLPAELTTAESAAQADLLRVHTPEYVDKVISGRLSEKEIRRIGLPWSPELVERSCRSVGSTIAACRSALQDGISINLAGGTHHAYPEHGEGYCVFNDAAVAARAMQAAKRARRIVILDCDVHQGNGTAAIFHQDPSVYTFSIHGAKNFPFHKEPSDLDVALPDGAGDDAYLEALDAGLEHALAHSAADLAIYLAGADPFVGDRLGKLSLTKLGLEQRDRLVFERCRRFSLPVAVVMAGGYGKDIHDTVDIHVNTVRVAKIFALNGNISSSKTEVAHDHL